MSNLKKKRQRRSLLDSDEEEDVNPLADKNRPSNQEKCNEVEGLPHNCEFLSNLKIAGLILETSRDIERPHKLQCEQALFQKKLEKVPFFHILRTLTSLISVQLLIMCR